MGGVIDNLNHAAARHEARRAGEARASQEELLEALLVEARRTNQLLEWLGGLVAAQSQRPE